MHKVPIFFIQSHYILFLFKIQLIFAFFDGKMKLKKIQIVTILTCVQCVPKGEKNDQSLSKGMVDIPGVIWYK